MTSFAPGARQTISLADGDMSALRWGAMDRAPDLIFLHATGFNAQTYAPLLGSLGDRHAIMAIDQRGHGQSTLPIHPHGMVDWRLYAGDLVALLDRRSANGDPPVMLVGHSLGGVVSILAAAERPQAVRGLVLLDPVMMPLWMRLIMFTPLGLPFMRRSPLSRGAAARRATFPSKDEALKIYRTRKLFAQWRPGFLEGYVESGFIEDGDHVRLACAPEWESATFAAQRNNSWGALAKLATPVHLLAAEHASTVIGSVAKVRRLAPRVRAEIVPGSSHLFPMEKPDVARDALAKMLQP
jgi:pimeloyl-ACP methyl ester carboxylesterase